MTDSGTEHHFSWIIKTVGAALVVYLIIIIVLLFVWSREPGSFDVREVARNEVGGEAGLVTGSVTTATRYWIKPAGISVTT